MVARLRTIASMGISANSASQTFADVSHRVGSASRGSRASVTSFTTSASFDAAWHARYASSSGMPVDSIAGGSALPTAKR